ncbi:MAG: CARDB domain-containing protein [Phototrophicaceae bacterium]
MHSRIIGLLFITALILSACNLGGTTNQEEFLDDTDSQNAGQPTITILSPSADDTFTVNEQVLVSVSATDSIGITRVQMLANGQSVKTVFSELADGEVSFEGVLDFIPRVEGDYTLRVIAFRDAISSPPVDLQITVGQPPLLITERPNTTGSSTGSSTGSTGNPIPVIPNDGVCRALTQVGLNMRTQPTTTRNNVITTFPQYTLLNVVARLGDNSWWKASSGSTVGWVSGNPQFVSISGNCNNIPIENVVLNTPTPSPTPLPTNTPIPTLIPITATPGLPDLIIPSLAMDEVIALPASESDVTVEVTIVVKNNGIGKTSQFDVTLTVERNGFDDVVYDVATVGDLDPGAIVTLTQDVVFDALGEYDIQVDVDPNNQVSESGEFNNRADTTVAVVLPS